MTKDFSPKWLTFYTNELKTIFKDPEDSFLRRMMIQKVFQLILITRFYLHLVEMMDKQGWINTRRV